MEADRILPNIIVGTLVVVAGVLIISFRRVLSDAMLKSQQRMLGHRYARASAGRQTPFMMGSVGFGFIVVGALMITVGLVTFLHA